MDTKKLEFIFSNMTPNERNKFLQRMSALNLATNVNTDSQFLAEAIDNVSKDYPFIKDILDV